MNVANHGIPSEYIKQIKNRLEKCQTSDELRSAVTHMFNLMNWNEYAYNFSWLGRPIIQLPQDTVSFQELIWSVRPDLIIETGIAHGGSLIMSASMLALLETFRFVQNPRVIGVDIDIRPANRRAIETHPASKWITLLKGSSTSDLILNQVKNISVGHKVIMVFLDSNHTHAHVLAELRAYTPLVSVGSYCVVLDTGIEDIDPTAVKQGREWCKGNSPKSALNEFLSHSAHFQLDDYYHKKAWMTSFSGGLIRRIF